MNILRTEKMKYIIIKKSIIIFWVKFKQFVCEHLRGENRNKFRIVFFLINTNLKKIMSLSRAVNLLSFLFQSLEFLKNANVLKVLTDLCLTGIFAPVLLKFLFK